MIIESLWDTKTQNVCSVTVKEEKVICKIVCYTDFKCEVVQISRLFATLLILFKNIQFLKLLE